MSQVNLVVRVWVPDRPGALGQVASRVGAVGGDVVGIEILERSAGRAIDELTVEVPDVALVELLMNEIAEIGDVVVEETRVLAGPATDPGVEALRAARAMFASATPRSVAQALAAHLGRSLDADWVAVVRAGTDPAVMAMVGTPPSLDELVALVARRAGGDSALDVVVAPLDPESCTSAAIACRDGRPIRAREREMAAELAAIAGLRRIELDSVGRMGR